MRQILMLIAAALLVAACAREEKPRGLDYDSQLRIRGDDVTFASGRDGGYACSGGGAEVRAQVSAHNKVDAEFVRAEAVSAMETQTPIEWIIADKTALIVFRTPRGEAFISGPAQSAAIGSEFVAGFTRRDAAIALRSFSCAGEQFPETRKG